MTQRWREALRLRLEDFVHTFVVNGAKQEDVFDAIIAEIGSLRADDVRVAESLPPMTCRTTPPNPAPCSTRSRCRDLR
ncbi:hypothetical protein [Rhizobium leguminosarum]|uniref:hypothetical protein n=1 Tax=Rhizobium leguminosarum TaxID=384 RepID=UPI00359C274C